MDTWGKAKLALSFRLDNLPEASEYRLVAETKAGNRHTLSKTQGFLDSVNSAITSGPHAVQYYSEGTGKKVFKVSAVSEEEYDTLGMSPFDQMRILQDELADLTTRRWDAHINGRLIIFRDSGSGHIVYVPWYTFFDMSAMMDALIYGMTPVAEWQPPPEPKARAPEPEQILKPVEVSKREAFVLKPTLDDIPDLDLGDITDDYEEPDYTGEEE